VILFSGILRGRGPRRVCDPQSGTGTGDNLSPRALTGAGDLTQTGGKTFSGSPAGIAPLPSLPGW
jgi:hypothetical protein